MLSINEKMYLIKDDIKIEWINLGEGNCLSFYQGTEQESNCLRFNVYVKNNKAKKHDDWIPVKNGSFCTCVSADASKEEHQRLLEVLMDFFYPVLHGHHKKSIKRIALKSSWLSESFTLEELKEMPSKDFHTFEPKLENIELLNDLVMLLIIVGVAVAVYTGINLFY